jgi:hypothetical protein
LIRIVGVERNEVPEKEFVLLQNQGGLRSNLKGHVVMSDHAMTTGDLIAGSYAFCDEMLIPPGTFVLLSTGVGESRWLRTKDGAMVFYAYMNRRASMWTQYQGPVHLLSLQHTYTGRKEALMLR